MTDEIKTEETTEEVVMPTEGAEMASTEETTEAPAEEAAA